MAKLFGNLHLVLLLGLIVAIGLIFCVSVDRPDVLSPNAILRWFHVFFGITWIGLLYYFNFVQIPTMPTIPAELKPGVSKFIAPKALFFFRWAALLTVLTGLSVAYVSGYAKEAMMLDRTYRLIGIGMYLALFMAANVWFVIWPNQKRALGIVPADDASKAASTKMAMMASRLNTLLSIPMLFAMTNFS
ncbi:Protein of unknown function [Sphingomonas sp. YR710]|jgi:uncharacterized membrane protein|uniref:urate hydroxylase PuuD n=1 Tax=Sphingomonas sp. YR710 TaxID=1882773 RepID=UPI000881D165|nr:urate hydroxylase PuuD [Sphingomonas sp. YR710]SDD21398.1 Protein of unknown function [Sphingomonas sp. YR710]